MTILERLKSAFSDSITSRIVMGAYYELAVKLMYSQNLLLSVPMSLAPDHVNCARIVFQNNPEIILAIKSIARDHIVTIRPDSVIQYGRTGIPIQCNENL